MRPLHAWVFVAMLSIPGVALAQNLDCPAPGGPGRTCDAFHYHALLYRPDTHGFVEAYGTSQFASMSACERARATAIRTNLSIVDFFKRARNEPYEPDRVGACHCDMTIERSSANYLTDAARETQKRAVADVRLRVREHLLDAELPSDSELVRSLAAPPLAAVLAGPKLVAMPSKAPAAPPENAVADLRPTRIGESSRPVAAAADLPLVDVITGTLVMPQESAGRTAGATPEQEPVADADEAMETFIAYETQRIQNVLKASSAIADEMVKAKIFEACMQRIQLLSNLRRLAQGSGARSRLGAQLRTAKSESERQAFVARLFGNDIKPHWAPKDAADVIIEPSEIDTDPDRVLRDATGRFSTAQKKRALYVVLARSQPTEDQQLWLTTVVDSFLR